MDSNLIAVIITAILAILGAFGAAKLTFTKFIKAVKESTDVGLAVNNASAYIEKALSDNVATAEEVEEAKKLLKLIKTEIDQAKEAWNNLFSKTK